MNRSANWTARIIEKIAAINKAQDYLEIGVNKGETFFQVEIVTKDAVDPNFLFDTKPLENESVRFFPETSDEFWTGGRGRVYDVIFLDGLHTFEQTFRDFVASLHHAHRKTVWLIDDTVPSDEFSAMSDQAACIRERKKANCPSGNWHGDVFKIVPALHDFFPTLTYATVVGSGNPQTIVWYQPRHNFAPKFNSLEAVSRLSFFDIAILEPIYNRRSEDATFAELGTAFAE